MADLNKKSLIVEVCSNIINKKEITNEDYQEAQTVIQELATKKDPVSRFELAQLVGFLVDDKFNQDINQYVNEMADYKNVALGDKAEFKKQKGVISAVWQAKGSTAQRTQVGSEYVTLETDEIAINPSVNLEQLQNGQIDFTALVNEASLQMQYALISKVQTVLYAYFSGLGAGAWFASANGVTSAIDPLITNIGRLGTPVVLGDVALLQKFVPLTGFNNYVTDANANQFHQTGLIGGYRGAKLVQLSNPLTNEADMTTTLLDKGYGYILPAGLEMSKRPLKIVTEGAMEVYENTNIQSRELEMPMYKKAGVGLVSTRYPLAMYEDTGL